MLGLSFAQLIDLAIGGLAIGCVYSLVALGFAMIMRATNIIHFAQGEVMMLGAMCGLTSLWLVPRLPLVAVLAVGMLASGVIAVAMELMVYRTLRRRRVSIMNVITATVGMSILCINAARLIWGSEPLRFPELFGTQAYEFAGLRISPQLFWIMVMGIGIMLALQLFLKHTRTGILMQAMAQDADAAQLMGANQTRMTAYTFGLAGLMAGAAGVMLGSMFFAFFEMGFITGLKGFVAATLGGLGSITGAMLGGILFGLIETFSAVFLSSAYKDGIGMLLLIAILLFLPSGLVGLWQKRW
ncbi:MAG: branched-chain amino acid ABC transporter permease [Xanthobacteraceae bacterium]|jgi:branched-chain amino acid transport system permease protein